MSGESEGGAGVLVAFSDGLADAVAQAGSSVVRVEARRRQSASGVAWGPDGLILTADHVLERDEDIAVGLPDGRTAAATVVGRDPSTDLALLRVGAADLPAVERGPAPKIGHLALVVARPGDGLATSIGVVSALLGPVRMLRGGQLQGLIRTDATFYPGFSGGPLVDAAGRMVGLATSRFGQGAGFAVPLETIDRVSNALLSHGRVRRGFLGLSTQPVDLPAGLRQSLSLGQEAGLLVVGLEPGGPADRGGLLIGDILIGMGDQAVQTTEDLRGLLGQESAGQSASARVIRGGTLQDVALTIGVRE